MAQSPSNILVLHAGALGDCVLTLHLIAAVKKSWDAPRVTVAARSSIVHWAQRHGFIDEARSIEEIGAHNLYHPVGELPERAARYLRGFDRVVSFLGARTEIVSQRLAQVLGREVPAIDPRPTAGLDTHIVRHWIEQMRGYALSLAVPTGDELEMRDRIALREQLRLRLRATKERTVLCHPGSGGLEKCCPYVVFERIVEKLKARSSSVAWMIGPDEVERFGFAYTRRLEQIAPVLYEESVDVAADLAAGADAFIGNDAGMTHVAALTGVPTIALFGPTDPQIWRPLGQRISVIRFPEVKEPSADWVQGVVSRLDALHSIPAPDYSATGC